MIRRLAISLLGPLFLANAAVALAQYSLNVRDVDVRVFVQDVARVTGRTIIVDGKVDGKVSVATSRSLSRSEYFEVFLVTLRANGLVAVPSSGGTLRVQRVDSAAGQPGQVGGSSAANQFVTEVFRLKSIDAKSAAETLRPIVSKDGSVTANAGANSVVVVDFADNVRRVRQIISRIDRDIGATAMLHLDNAPAREVANALQALAGSSGENAPGITRIAAVESSNSVILRGEPGAVAHMAMTARDLDRQAARDTEIKTYWLKHADAEKLLPVLLALVGQSGAIIAPTTPQQGGAPPAAPPQLSGGSSGGIARYANTVVTRYEGANAIIIAGNSEVQRMLSGTIADLDTRRDQVLVEAIIVEISDTAARKLGVQFLLGNAKNGFAATNYSNASPNILSLGGAYAATKLGTTTTKVTAPDGTVTETTSTTNSDLSNTLQQAAVSSIMNATGGFGGYTHQFGDGTIFGTILSAVRSDTDSNILSTPSVLTLDNQKASLLVGQEVPITTGEALSSGNFDNKFRTVQREKVGIQLEVRPQINAGGAIKLALRQEVSSIAGPVSNDNSDLIINKRELETTVTVDDGQILALGGLLDDNERRTIERIPLLSDIPGLGELFKSRARSRVKTNLMIFIRPTVLHSKEDGEALTTQRYGYIRGQQAQKSPDMEPSIDTLVRDYMGVQSPITTRDPGPQPTRETAPTSKTGEVIVPETRASSKIVRPLAGER
jgi:general secretion pathway protein D